VATIPYYFTHAMLANMFDYDTILNFMKGVKGLQA